MHVRRAKYVFFACCDPTVFDVSDVLDGAVAAAPIQQVLAFSIPTGSWVVISPVEFERLQQLSSQHWTDSAQIAEAIGAEALQRLLENGLMVSDDDAIRARVFHARDETLHVEQWNAFAALYHFMTTWKDMDVSWAVKRTDEPHPTDEEFLAAAQNAPPAFHVARPDQAPMHLALPQGSDDQSLYGLLRRRSTTREFDETVGLSAEQLSIILYYVFGCQGYVSENGQVVALRKTSPSGGALHPIEVYPLLINTANFEPGLYHYRSDLHAIELLQNFSEIRAKEVANEFVAGQWYFASASALFIFTSRFFRSHWKYAKHDKAYAVQLMDVGHLSQTFYLVATELGLGCFVTAAINNRNIEDALGIDGYREGALAVCGCGFGSIPGGGLDPDFAPYLPPSAGPEAGG